MKSDAVDTRAKLPARHAMAVRTPDVRRAAVASFERWQRQRLPVVLPDARALPHGKRAFAPSLSLSARTRIEPRGDRRKVPRGGRRQSDRPGQHPTLVIAESDAPARVPCVWYLWSYGFRVEEAADGDQALAVIKAVHPHVILTEATLPITPAHDLSRRLAEDPGTRDIPLIVMADDVAAQSLEHVSTQPAGVLIKPFELPVMLEEIRGVLRSHLTA